MTIPPVITARLKQYCQRHDVVPIQLLGQGKDGCVWVNDRRNALKIHHYASAKLDTPYDLIEDEGHTLADLVYERFGDRAPEIFYLRQQLEQRAGIYLIDIHPHNIKFANP